MVGGKGTRLRPLTFETPKQMLPLVGTPMIETVLESLASHGVTEAVLSLGYLPESFIQAYPSNIIAGVKVTYAVEPEPLDTAGAIRFAAEFAGIDETFLVVNGDVLTELNVTRLLEFHRARGAEATIALHPVEDPSRFGVVPTTPEGKVIDFVEKPPREEAPTNLINAGTYVFEPSVLSRIAPLGRVSVERETFPVLAGEGVLYALADENYWLDTGTPQAFIQANVDLLKGREHVHEFVGIADGSWVHPSATVDPTATIINSVIDRDCIVSHNVILTEAILMPGAIVQPDTQISSSIIGPGAVVGSSSVLGAICVVGANEHVAPNSELSGDVRLGGV
ncbi:MAG: NDP-sugar synthase [Actinomycetota bacterium]